VAVGGCELGAAGVCPLPDLGSEILPSLEVEDGSPGDWFWRAAWGHVLLSYLVVLFRHEGDDTHQHFWKVSRVGSQYYDQGCWQV